MPQRSREQVPFFDWSALYTEHAETYRTIIDRTAASGGFILQSAVADFETALTETRASVTADMLEEYSRIQDTLKSDATRPLGGIGFVLPGMLRPKEGGKP